MHAFLDGILICNDEDQISYTTWIAQKLIHFMEHIASSKDSFVSLPNGI